MPYLTTELKYVPLPQELKWKARGIAVLEFKGHALIMAAINYQSSVDRSFIKRGGLPTPRAALFLILIFGACMMLPLSCALAQDDSMPSPRGSAVASPKAPWGQFDVVEEEAPPPVWMQILDWFPNRLVDFIDIFRVDVGVGPAYGAVARVTKWGQFGYRQMAPFSVRVGPRGRRFPAMIESSSEIGIGPAFIESKDREVCSGELGAGIDLIAGGYIGVCVDELFDFAAGVFFWDPKDDDPIR